MQWALQRGGTAVLLAVEAAMRWHAAPPMRGYGVTERLGYGVPWVPHGCSTAARVSQPVRRHADTQRRKHGLTAAPVSRYCLQWALHRGPVRPRSGTGSG
jgi:hypothetical protein